MFDCGMMKKAGKHSVTKADIFLLLGVLLCALILFSFFYLHRTPGVYAEISYDGVVLKRISLSGPEEKYYLIGKVPVQEDDTAAQREGMSAGEKAAPADGNPQITVYELKEEEWMEWQDAVLEFTEEETGVYNVFSCRNGEVRMLKSNCPDKICVHHGAIDTVGENIVCLPHRVVIEITGGEEKKLDGVVY